MSADIALPRPNTASQRVGQGTEIEKSRAAAEVYYRLAAAKEMPRDEARAYEQMRKACANPALAEKAFYSVPKGSGGDKATGPSVHLARELARIWQNIDYGVVELRRDDEFGQSEMQAFALDLETNTRPSYLFIQPHRRDLTGGRSKNLTSVQDVYESNANAGARRVREAIFNVLPAAFVAEAQAICRATAEQGDGKPIEQRRAAVIRAFKASFGITEQQLVARLGRSSDRWDAQDVTDLEVLGRSLKAGEVQKDVEFPVVPVTVDEIKASARRPSADPAVPADEDEAAMLREQQEMEAEIAAEETGP
ncbi:hypothetical protein GCM10023403_10300 [Pseudonocardia benzenivorans]